eukprot:TRINITY_DN3313_c0_g1_i2.p1 TRINITY_DN3313_c0_g1~~TRINITY_DN3313_c0_g1_i2.p1  ORF type:complete len:468 (+),score=117.73 TRINITY_DN3313_c0_g1_i2:158-1561(+)
MNMQQILVILCLFGVCLAQMTPLNVPITISGTANQNQQNLGGTVDVGTFQGFSTDFTGSEGYKFITQGNKARGGEGAFSGDRTFSSGVATIQDAELYLSGNAENNIARANGSNSVAGSQVVLATINGSVVERLSDTSGNKAIVTAQPAPASVQAIAGSQTQVAQSITNSYFTAESTSFDNIAKNKANGDAVAGDENAINSAQDSAIYLNATASDNYARADNGDAVAGSKNGLTTVEDSSIFIESQTSDNFAKASGGNAVAGSEINFGSIVGSFPGGGASVEIEQVVENNKAVSKGNGSSVAGATTNIVSATNADIDISSQAFNNIAKTRNYGSIAEDAVSGIAVTLADISDTTLTIDANATSNYARNTASDAGGSYENDAIAGFNLDIGNAYDSEIIIVANSTNNFARARDGDAVAGNKVNITDTDSSTIVVMDLEAANNTATSSNGGAYIDSAVYIGGDATKFYAR